MMMEKERMISRGYVGGKCGVSLRTSSLGPLHLAQGRINHAGEGMGIKMLKLVIGVSWGGK